MNTGVIRSKNTCPIARTIPVSLLSELLAEGLRAEPAQVAGKWVNREFWHDEFAHLLNVIDGFDERLQRMKSVYEQHSRRVGDEYDRDEFGNPHRRISDPTSPKQRREDASGASVCIENFRRSSVRIADCDARGI